MFNNALVPDLASLVWLVHGPYGRERYLLMLTAYLDESHDEKQEHVFIVAGFLAPARDWNCLWGAWDRALVEEDIPEVHWAELVGGHGKTFGEMAEDRRLEIQRRFIEIILSHRIAGFACGLEMEPYRPFRNLLGNLRRFLPGSKWSGKLPEPYYLPFQAVIEEMATYWQLQPLPDTERIGFVFDRNRAVQGRAEGLFESMKGWPVPLAKRLGEIAFAERIRTKPLQAADIFAYEAYRYYGDRIAGRTPRWQWIALRHRLVGDYPVMGEKLLRALVEKHKKYPNGEPPPPPEGPKFIRLQDEEG